MKTNKLGLAVVAMLGVVLLGTGAGPSSVARAAGPTHDGASAPSAVQTGDDDGSEPVAPMTKSSAGEGQKGKIEQTPSSTSVKTTTTPAPLEAVNGTCPTGMVDVEGDYCAHVEQTCLRWLDPDQKMRCAEFAPASRCEGKVTHKHFCIDQYEYPNKPGAKPVVMDSWYQAREACSAEGKRLCGDSEWTLACEGQERMPYPYGYARNSDACNIDKPHPDVDEKALASPSTRDAEVERLWQGEPSGSREACVSPYGVHDMTGNVDEWVVNEAAHPYKSGLKGGYWGPVRDRCRPMTTAHDEQFTFYQIGFRCCEDSASQGASPVDVPKVSEPPAAGRPGTGNTPGTINTGANVSPSDGSGVSVLAGS